MSVRHTIVRSAAIPPRVSWGAALAGAVVASAIWLLLHLLAIGVGLSVVADDGGSLEAIGVGTGLWSLAAPAVALFMGGLVAGRLAGIADRVSGALHGAVLWAVTVLVGFVLVVFFVSRMFGGVDKLGGAAVAVATQDAPVTQVVEAARPAADEPGRVQQLEMMGIDSAGLIAHVNRKLVAAGASPIRADQVDAIATELTGAGLTGRLTREKVLETVVKHTGMTHEHAEQVARELEAEMAGQSPLAAARALSKRNAPGRAQTPAHEGGHVARGSDISAPVSDVANGAGNALLWVALALTLGLAAGMLGASLGVSTKQRRLAESVPVAVPMVPPTTADH